MLLSLRLLMCARACARMHMCAPADAPTNLADTSDTGIDADAAAASLSPCHDHAPPRCSRAQARLYRGGRVHVRAGASALHRGHGRTRRSAGRGAVRVNGRHAAARIGGRSWRLGLAGG